VNDKSRKLSKLDSANCLPLILVGVFSPAVRNQWCSCEISSGQTPMASAVARAYMGVWGKSPQRGAGAAPWWGLRGRSPLKQKLFLYRLVLFFAISEAHLS